MLRIYYHHLALLVVGNWIRLMLRELEHVEVIGIAVNTVAATQSQMDSRSCAFNASSLELIDKLLRLVRLSLDEDQLFSLIMLQRRLLVINYLFFGID